MSKRFVTLDGWRGICACLVAVYHLSTYSHVYGWSFIRNSWLFVDFFFVLSGFVIAVNYGDRLRDGFGVFRFMALRFGRIFPLHFVTLAAFVSFELLLLLVPVLGAMRAEPPFGNPAMHPSTILPNLLLIHNLGLYQFNTWNVPSWSISAEFYTYAAFAVSLVVAGRWFWLVLLLVIVGSPILLLSSGANDIFLTHNLGFVRCIYGFCMGVIVWSMYRRWSSSLHKLLTGKVVATTVELVAVLATYSFVAFGAHSLISFAAPIVFGAVILVFAAERGAVSTFLTTRPLVVLGTLSYSIYLVHRFLEFRLWNLVEFTEKFLDITLQTYVNGDKLIGTTLWLGDLYNALVLGLVIAVSYFSYRLIEIPGQKFFRRFTFRPVPQMDLK